MNPHYYGQGAYGPPSDGNSSNSMNSFYNTYHKHYHGPPRGMNGFHQYNSSSHQQQGFFYNYGNESTQEYYYYKESSTSHHQPHRPWQQKRRGRGRGVASGGNPENKRGGSHVVTSARRCHSRNAEQVGHKQSEESSSQDFSSIPESQHVVQDKSKPSVNQSQTRDHEVRQPNTRNYHRNSSSKQSNYYSRTEARKSGNSKYSEWHSRMYMQSGQSSRQFTQQRNYNFRQGTQEDIESQRGAMIEELFSNSYECMVCCDVIRHKSPVWSCTNCYRIYHLHCIKKWARSSAALEDGSTGWRCPACQNVNEQYPTQYRCFCGKVINPDVNRQDTPHSCGEICGKKRPHDCTHPCNILCHPGPCPPCQASVTKYCDCQKTKQTVKCGQPSSVKCTQKCDKTLNCGHHQCQQLCHQGQCDPCAVEITQVCFCGKASRTVCWGSAESFQSSYSCKLICDRKLSCDNHHCDKICHPGPCDDCKLLPSVVTHCPCGKVKLTEIAGFTERVSCLDPIPTCSNVCDRELSCGPKEGPHHSCERQCHTGPCGPCQGTSEVTCRCGKCTKEMTCEEAASYTEEKPFLCDIRCNKKRQCGRHKCGKLCCVDTEHKCDQVCGRKLSCGLHRCEEPCHRGNCPTCWQVSFDELCCHCGLQVIYPPVPCGTKAPECTQPCTRPQACGHPVRHNCHVEDQCPPCTELTDKWCYGRHELRHNIHCYQKEVSCGMPCNKALPCGIHKCQKPCHKGECLSDNEVCRQPCPQTRPLCGHPCGVPCHGTEPCPRVSCKTEVILRCQCGNREEKALCMMGGETDDNTEYIKMETSLLALTMANAQHGETIDISGLLKESHKKRPKRLECNSQCSIKERNKRLALALEIKNPDLSGKLGNPAYTAFLKDYAKQYTTFVASIEQELSKLVNISQQSKQPKRSHAFKPMNSVQRRVVHELAEYYGCETQSYDEEPNKNVVATAYRGKCWHPTVSLTQLIQRELHPKAPTPIPHHGKEAQIRSSVEASKQSTSVLGAWGKLRPMATTATSSPATTRTSSWSAATTTTSTDNVTNNKTNITEMKLTSLTEEKKEKSLPGTAPDGMVDYFDMDQ